MGYYISRIADIILGALKRFGLWILREDAEDHPEGKHVPKLKLEKPKKPKRRRYPKIKEVVPVYRQDRILEIVEHLPTDVVLAYKYTLVCPVCGREVKRSEEYCGECGSHIMHEYRKAAQA